MSRHECARWDKQDWKLTYVADETGRFYEIKCRMPLDVPEKYFGCSLTADWADYRRYVVEDLFTVLSAGESVVHSE